MITHPKEWLEEMGEAQTGELKEYADYFIEKDHVKVLSEDVRETISTKWLNILKSFNENHKYLGYDLLIFRKRLLFEEPELFIST